MEDNFYIQSLECSKDINLKIKDTVICADRSNMTVKIDVSMHIDENEILKRSHFKGNIDFSIIKINTDRRGALKHFFKIEKSSTLSQADIEFSNEYNRFTIKKAITGDEPEENYMIEIELEEFTRSSTKTITTNHTLEKRIQKESEIIQCDFKVMGTINNDCLSGKAICSSQINIKRDKVNSKNNYHYPIE